MAGYSKGDYPLNTNPLVIVPYITTPIQSNEERPDTVFPIMSLYNAQYFLPDAGKYITERIIHPSLGAKHMKDFTSLYLRNDPDEENNMQNTALLAEFLFPFTKANIMESKEGLLQLFESYELTSPNESESLSYYEIFEHLRSALQSKFPVRFAFIEGNHRIVVANKLLSKKPFGNNINYKNPQAQTYDIVHHECGIHKDFNTTIYLFEEEFPSSIDCKRESNYIRSCQDIGFQSTVSDVVLRTLDELSQFRNNKNITIDSLLTSDFVDPKTNQMMTYLVTGNNIPRTDQFSNNVMLPVLKIIATEFFSHGAIKDLLLKAKNDDVTSVQNDIQAYGYAYSGLVSTSMFQNKRPISSKGKSIPFHARNVIEILKMASLEKSTLTHLRNILSSGQFNKIQNDRKDCSLEFGTYDFFFKLNKCVKVSAEYFADVLTRTMIGNGIQRNSIRKTKWEFLYRFYILSDILQVLNDIGEDPVFDETLFHHLASQDEENCLKDIDDATLPDILLQNYHLHVKYIVEVYDTFAEDCAAVWQPYFLEKKQDLDKGIIPKNETADLYASGSFDSEMYLTFTEYCQLFFMEMEAYDKVKETILKHRYSNISIEERIRFVLNKRNKENKTKSKKKPSAKTKQATPSENEEEPSATKESDNDENLPKDKTTSSNEVSNKQPPSNEKITTPPSKPDPAIQPNQESNNPPVEPFTTPPKKESVDTINPESDNLLVCYEFIQRIIHQIDQDGKVNEETKQQCDILVKGLDDHFKKSNVVLPKTPQEKQQFKTNFQGYHDILSVYEPIDLTDSANHTSKADNETTTDNLVNPRQGA